MTDPANKGGSSSANEAEQTIEAIHQGDVDALVVSGPNGPQVVMLDNGDQPYRLLVERMSEGALTLDASKRIMYANRRLIELTGMPADGIVGTDLASLIEGPVTLDSDSGSFEARLRCQGRTIPVSVWFSTLSIGGTHSRLATITDLSVQHQVEEVVSAERFARSILEQSTEAVVVLAPNGRITHASLIAEDIAGRSPIGLTFSDAFTVDERDHAQVGDLVSLPAGSLDTMLAAKPFHGVELRLGQGKGRDRSFLLSAGPLLDENRTAVGAIVTLTDITERKRAEERQTVLVAELNHRVKNILAVVQAVAAQTLRTSSSLQAFSAAFSGRIKALSLAHDILTRTRWTGIGLNELLEGVLSPYRMTEPRRVRLLGPPVLLPARAVVPLSMALHEMATNASKYGALSSPSGTVQVEWSVGRNGTSLVDMRWLERGGPELTAGKRSGFGTTLIDRVVRNDLEGTVDLVFAEDGLHGTLKFPLRTYSDLNDLSGGAQQSP